MQCFEKGGQYFDAVIYSVSYKGTMIAQLRRCISLWK